MKPEKRQFLQIINESRGVIRSLCRVYFRSIEDQEDAYQDVILQLWKSFDSFRGDAQLKTWIYRVSLNTILGKIRKEKKSVHAESIDTSHLSIASAGADDHVELFSIIIQSLKEVDKAIVLLYLEGYQNKEIAEMLEMSPTNVSTRLNRVKTNLKLKFNHKCHATGRL
ncbi:MAG: sigma-70 family RNA polymerase sigma factor [Cytophagia bacterium]|nr:sigma-70 family RNA polymerase sigma factor [Cytophagia bacterium]